SSSRNAGKASISRSLLSVTEAVEINPRRAISRLASRILSHTPGRPRLSSCACAVAASIEITNLESPAPAADAPRLEQSAVAHQHHFHTFAGSMSDDVGQIRMQRRFAAGEDQITDALAEQDVDGVECALALDIFPALLRQGVAGKIAEAAIGIAGIVERELTASGTARRRDEA